MVTPWLACQLVDRKQKFIIELRDTSTGEAAPTAPGVELGDNWNAWAHSINPWVI